MVKRKRRNKKMKNYRVMIRLLLTIAVFICIPMLLVNVYIASVDIKRIQAQKMESYQVYTNNFKDFFDHELDKMFACSIDLSVNKTITEKDVSVEKRYLWDTFAKVRNYRNGIPIAEDVFIHVQSYPYVLGSEYGYDSAYFAKTFLTGDEGEPGLLSLGEGKKIVKALGQAEGMFVVYQASVRRTSDTSVLFYITTEKLNDAFYDLSNGDAETYICNMDGEILLSNRNTAQAANGQPAFAEFVKDLTMDADNIMIGGETWYLFKSYDGKNDLIFITAVSAEKLLEPVKSARSYNAIFLILEFFLCIIVLVCVVCFNYQPIRRLKKKYLDGRTWEAENEIEGISRLLEQTIADRQSLSSLVEDRTTQLSVYVLRGMLNGEDIPDAQRRLLSLNKALDDMFVIAVQEIELDAETEGEVIERLVDGLERVVYTMVDSYENCLLFACMISERDESVRIEMAESLKKILSAETLNENFRMGIGEFCSIKEGVRTARITALIALEQSSYGKITYYENALNDFRHIAFYPNRQMLTYIRYVKEGNGGQALLMLEEIMNSISKNVQSNIMKQYVYYDIVNEFMKLVTSLDIQMEEGKIYTLMRFETIKELKELLAELTIAACREVEDRKLLAEQELVQKILQFIYDNISDSNLSREMVADRFHISTNTVSLLCTNVIGCGFRELIVARRIELAQKLLLETELSVNQVAERAGFRDTSYFIKIFKKMTGRTPRAFQSEMF